MSGDSDIERTLGRVISKTRALSARKQYCSNFTRTHRLFPDSQILRSIFFDFLEIQSIDRLNLSARRLLMLRCKRKQIPINMINLIQQLFLSALVQFIPPTKDMRLFLRFQQLLYTLNIHSKPQ